MKKNYFVSYFLILVFALINIPKSSAQSFLGRFWQKQKRNIVFMGEYDDTLPYYIGITAEYAHSHYIIQKNPDWHSIDVELPNGDSDRFSSITTSRGSEFGVGIPVRIRINEFASFSTAITWFPYRGDSYSSIRGGKPIGTHLAYNYVHPTNLSSILFQSEEVHSSSDERGNFKTFEVPLHFKLHSDKKFMGVHDIHPYRLYILGGGRFISNLRASKFNHELGNFAKSRDNPLNFKPKYVNLETGIGIDKYFPYFKASVELRYSQSLGNILDHQKYAEIKDHFRNHPTDPKPNYSNPYMEAIDRLGIRGWQLSIILE